LRLFWHRVSSVRVRYGCHLTRAHRGDKARAGQEAPSFLDEEEKTLTEAEWKRPRSVALEFPSPVRAREVFGSGRWEGKILKHVVAPDRPWVFFLEAS